MDQTKPSRRDFCAHAVSFITLGTLMESCGGSPTSPGKVAITPVATISAGVVNNTITLTVDSGSPLASVGSAALIQTNSGNFLVAHTGDSTFNAMTAVCTHEGCTVEG